MIFTGFVYLATFLLSALIAILPASSGFPVEVQNAFDTFAGYVQLLDTILPIATLAIVIGIIVSVDVAIFSFKSFKWLISHLPFVGGRG